VPQLEAWQMVYVNESFLNTSHGKIECISCHSGNKDDYTKAGAHTDLIAYPSDEENVFCSSCHKEEENNFHTSLHKNQNGYFNLFYQRAGFDLKSDPAKLAHFNEECGKCHVSCGQCHVARPMAVNGGFLDGHNFKALPNMTNNCTACHGSRVGEEYTGNREHERADVHWESYGKRCDYCHPAEEMHGNGIVLNSRYDENNTYLPKCEDCHSDDQDANDFHRMHWTGNFGKTVSCYVCHSQPYKNCYNCHAGTGIERPSNITFKIGRNYNKSNRYPWDFITVRHIPVSPETYSSWGVTLPNYDALPTWKMATPHNILKKTALTDTTGGLNCYEKCHNSENYLKASDLESYEINANQSVIIK
jgi:hypothetical protein